MKDFFSQDKVYVAIIVGLGTVLLVGCFLSIGMRLAGISFMDNLRWIGCAFIPLILILRAYMKTGKHLVVSRTLIVVLFVLFLIFIFAMMKTNSISFK